MLCLLLWTYPSFRLLISRVHFDHLGRVWLVLGLAWAYLFFNDFFPAYYAHGHDKMDYYYYDAFGRFAAPWWLLVIGNFVCPLMCLAFRQFRRSIVPMFILSIIVNICMYIERLVIVIPGTEVYNATNFNTLPYSISPTEFSIVCATFGWVIGGLTFFCRVFPILPYWELAETRSRQITKTFGGVTVNYFQSGE